MKTVYVNKPHSWLQWPVTVKDCSKPTLHITAKFFGAADIDPFSVSQHLSYTYTRKRFDSCEFKWIPEIFSQGHVLKLTKFPRDMQAIHDFFHLIVDEFTPWKPHITVPRDYWILVDSNGLTPDSQELKIGPIELCLGNNTATAKGQGEKENANHS